MGESRWWGPPAFRTRQERPRHSTWLELFFDLVFVVAVSQLAFRLARDLSMVGVAQFVFLYVPIWWAWFNATIYADRFDTDDLGHRTLTFVMMLAVAGAASTVAGVFEGQSTGFAISYIAVRSVQVFLYARVYRHIQAARPLASRFASLISLSTGIWAISLLLAPPLRFVLWGAALVLDIGVVWHRSTRRRYAPLPVSRSHLPERFGLFTIIVLGESVLGVVSGLVSSRGGFETEVIAGLGLVMAFSIWWIYFEKTNGSVFHLLGTIRPVVWVYSHMPLMIAVTALGVGVEEAVLHDPMSPLGPERWLLAGGVTVALLAVSLIIFSQEGRGRRVNLWRLLLVASAAATGAFLGLLPALAFVGVLATITVIQATFDVLTSEGSHIKRQVS